MFRFKIDRVVFDSRISSGSPRLRKLPERLTKRRNWCPSVSPNACSHQGSSRGISAIRRYAALFRSICRSERALIALKIQECAERAVNRRVQLRRTRSPVFESARQNRGRHRQVTGNEGANVLRWQRSWVFEIPSPCRAESPRAARWATLRLTARHFSGRATNCQSHAMRGVANKGNADVDTGIAAVRRQ